MTQSRIEAILKNEDTSKPLSRIEELIKDYTPSSSPFPAPRPEDGQDFEEADIDDIMAEISKNND